MKFIQANTWTDEDEQKYRQKLLDDVITDIERRIAGKVTHQTSFHMDSYSDYNVRKALSYFGSKGYYVYITGYYDGKVNHVVISRRPLHNGDTPGVYSDKVEEKTGLTKGDFIAVALACLVLAGLIILILVK